MVFEDLIRTPGEWLQAKGAYSEIVLSSRVRLARNLSLFPFVKRAKVSDLRAILSRMKEISSDSETLKQALFLELKGLSALQAQFLQERHLISLEMARDNTGGGVVVGKLEKFALMINEEDHLRLQSFASGLSLKAAHSILDDLDNELEKRLDYAFSEEFGYLTACPTNTGTGMRASVLIHLPALVLTKEIEKVLRGVSQVGLAVRGLYGEGSEVKGNFFQVSNQTTLGRSEEDILGGLEKVTKQLIEYEKHARETLVESARPQIEDKIFRALGLLENARLLTSEEVLNLSSAVRLGVGLGMVRSVELKTLNELLIFTQPAHLQRLFGTEMEPAQRDEKRAEYVRQRLG